MRQHRWYILGTILSIICFFCSCCIVNYFPEEGEWYCGELKMQLSFDHGGDCYVIVDGQKIKCGCGADPGSNWLMVGCQETDSEYYLLGEEVFGARFVKLSERQLVVFDPSSGKEYCFVRVS